MAFARRTWLYTLCLWLSLAMVLGHALAPVGSPLVARSGSAFSSATFEVSLGAVRTGLLAKIKRAQDGEPEGGNTPSAGGAAILIAAAAPPIAPPTPAAFTLPDRPIPAFDPARSFNARAPPRA